MKIASFNTNSVRVRMPIIIDWLTREQPDIVCLQETKVQDKDFPEDPLKSAGYETIFHGQKSYNGVAVISKRPFEDVHQKLYDDIDEEARFIRARFEHMTVINVYVPQGFAPGTDKFDYKLRWLKDLLSYIKESFVPTDPLLLAGDFNVAREPKDLFDPDGFRGEAGYHPDEQAIMGEILDWGFVDIFRKHQPEAGHYTFWDYRIPNGFKRNLGWRIDYILATAPLAEKSLGSWIDKGPRSRPKPSDHTFLVAEFQI